MAMTDAIRNNTTLILGLATPILTAAIIAVAGFMWHANMKLTNIVAQQNFINKSLDTINATLTGFETRAHVKEQYQAIQRTDQDQYKKIDRNSRAITKMGSRVQRLEDRQR
jgi:hypothetical protein